MPPLAKLPQIQIGTPAGTNPKDAQQAQDAMAIETTPQVNSINSMIQTIQGYLDRDVAAQQNYGTIADQKLSEIGTQLAQQLQGNVGKIGDIYSQGSQTVGKAYDEAGATLQGVNKDLMSGLQSKAAKLGQTAALHPGSQFSANPLERLSAESGILQQRNATGKAAATSNLDTLGTQMKAIAQKAVGDSEQDYAQKRSNVASTVLRTIGELQLKSNESTQSLLQKYSDLVETAAPKFRQLLQGITAARTEAEHQNAMDAFKQQLDLAQLGVSQQNANTASAKAFKEDDPNSLDNQIKMQTLAKGERELGRGSYIDDAQGNENLMAYLNGIVRKDRKDPNGISGTAYAGIQNFINQYGSQSSISGIYNTTDPVAILRAKVQESIDPKTGKVNLPVTAGSKYKQSDYQVDIQTLLEAIGQRYTNVGTGAKVGGKI